MTGALIESIRIDQIDLSRRFKGRKLNDAKVQELAGSIQRVGLMQPVVVTRNGKIRLVAGEHRISAVKLLGWEEVPCRVYPELERDQAEAMEISENLIRNEGTVLEQSLGWARLKDLQEAAGLARKNGQHKLGQNDQASFVAQTQEATGKSREQIQRYIRVGAELNSRPKVVQALEDAGFTDEQDALRKLVGPKSAPLTEAQQLKAVQLAQEIEAKNKEDKRKLGAGQALKRGIATMLRQEAVATAPPPPVWDGAIQPNTVQVAEIGTLIERLPSGCADLVFTDPPYHEEHLPLYGKLAEVALHALKPGGFCFAYAGLQYLDQIIVAMSASLEYQWIIALGMPFGNHAVGQRGVFSKWRPVLVFRKPGSEVKPIGLAQDYILTSKAKAFHDWQQDTECPTEIIEHFCPAGGVVLEPFSGGGTTAFVAKSLGRNYLAFDKDPFAVSVSIERLRND
jgi:ParB/RepB/Spo0J family partition protein